MNDSKNSIKDIVDVDTKDIEYLNDIILFINNLRPESDKIESIIPTKSGYHLITKKFDSKTFKDKYLTVDIQKKNPTLLYLPDVLE